MTKRTFANLSAAVLGTALLLGALRPSTPLPRTSWGGTAHAYPDGEEVALTTRLSGRLSSQGKQPQSFPASFYLAESRAQRFVGYLVLEVNGKLLPFSTTLAQRTGEATLDLRATERRGWLPAPADAAKLEGTCKRPTDVDNFECTGRVTLAGKTEEMTLVLFGGREAAKLKLAYPGKLTLDEAPNQAEDAELLLVHDKQTRMHGILVVDTQNRSHVFEAAVDIAAAGAAYTLSGSTREGRELRAECTPQDDGTTTCQGALWQDEKKKPLGIVFYGEPSG